MKIVILTAGIGEKKTSIPRCFTTTIGSVALIEYLVRILRLLNIPPNDIYLATSSSIMWGSKKYHDTISSLGVNEIIIEKKFKHSFPTLLKSLKNFKSEDVLVVNGDNYFKFSDLEYLIYNNSNINKALIHKRNSVASKEPILDLIKNKILKIVTQNQSKKIPWYTYYGAIYLKKSDVIKIKKFKLFDVPYLECLVNKMKIKVETKEISSISDKNSEYKLKELKGGSFAGLKKMILVHKQADKIGRDKLINEIKRIQNLDQKASKKFPTIINYEISKNSAWYTMPWYPIDNLRQKIISGVFGINEISYNIKPVLNFLWENLYLKKKQKANLDWVNKKHFDRYYKRQNKLKKIQPFKKILELNKILINGHQYQNLPNIMNEVKNLSDKYKVFVPNSLFRIHGDLHFQNILVGDKPGDFMLADPQGDLNGSDIYYDMGKLWHSFHGKYDLIHSDFSELKKVSGEKYSYFVSLGPKYLLETYDEIEKLFLKIMLSYPVSNDNNWVLKTKFSEFMHFASVMDFHLKFDKNEKKAILMYMRAVMLGSELLILIKN